MLLFGSPPPLQHLKKQVRYLGEIAVLFTYTLKAVPLPPLNVPGKLWSPSVKISGALLCGVSMLCGVLQVMQILLPGSKEQAMFWCILFC